MRGRVTRMIGKLGKSLRTKMTAIFGIIVLAGCLILGIVSYNRAAKSLQEEADEALLKTAKQAAQTVDTLIQGRMALVESIASRDVIRGRYGDRAATLEEKLQVLRDEQKRVEDLGYKQFGIADRQGNLFLSDGSSANIADRDYFKEALLGKTVISSTFVSRVDNSMIVAYATPIRGYGTGEITGVLVSLVDANRLSQLLSSINYGRTGYGFAVDSTGTVVAHKDTQYVTDRTNWIEQAKSDGSLASLADVIAKMARGEEGVGTYTFQGVDKFVGYAPVKSAGWSVGINVPAEEVLQRVATLKQSVFIISLIIIIIALAATFVIAKTITNPLVLAVDHLGLIANGDFTNPVPDQFLRMKDEIGRLAQAIDQLQNSLRPLLGGLRNDARILAGSSESLSAASEEIASSSSEVARAIEQVASGAGEQASNLQDILHLMSNIASNLDAVYTQLGSVRANSENASQLAAVGKNELDALVGSIEGVREAFRSVAERLKALNGSVNQVGEILNVINGIAEQTNLLALNAAIEAARAGEAGRGFAVVAEEVRKLAEESKASSDKIGALLNAIIAETSEVVGTSEEAGKQVAMQLEKVDNTVRSFDDILNSVTSITPAVEATYREVDSTVKAKDVVLERLQNISSVSEETSASAEEISASAEELTASTEEIAANAQEILTVGRRLEEGVERFKV